MTRRASVDFAAAAAKTAKYADILKAKDDAIHAKAKTPPGRDASAMNVARAKREGWTGTPGPSHTPGQ
jgi:hypothetical protein